MIDWLVNKLFWWTPLRKAIFNEVHMYDMIEERLKDKSFGSLYWAEEDGWRSVSFNKERGRYYFNDIPSDSLHSCMDFSREMTYSPEFDIDEVW
jgi:hypothetical protein